MKLQWWALTVILPVILLIGIACGGTAATPTTTTSGIAPTPAPQATASARPQATQAAPTVVAAKQLVQPRLRMTIVNPVDQVTMWYQGFGTSPFIRATFDQLIWTDRFTEQNKPMMATDWGVSADGTDWTFNLRKGIPWHTSPAFDGDEFTCKDVQVSFDVMHAPGNRPHNVPAWEEKLEIADNIECVDDYTAIFHLNSPWATLENGLNEEKGDVMTMTSKKAWDLIGQEGYEDHPIGTGPFKFVELVINEHYLVERFKDVGDDHWWQIPEFDELQLFFVGESATRLAQLVAEETDLAELPVLLIDEAERQGFEVNTSTVPGGYLWGHFSGQNHRATYTENPEIQADAILDGHRKPHGVEPNYYPDDPLVQLNVRKAMNHAVDRQLLKDTFFGERVSLDSVHAMFGFREPWNDDWVPYAYDPDLSRQLLAEAGYGPGDISITVLGSDQWPAFPEGADIAESLIDMWNAIGINTKLQVFETNEIYLRMRKFTITRNFVSIAQFPVIDLELLWNSAVHGPGSAIFYDGILTEKLFEFQAALKAADRNRLALEYGQRMYDQYATIPLFARPPQSALNPATIAEHQSNYGSIGPMRHTEFTKAVYK